MNGKDVLASLYRGLFYRQHQPAENPLILVMIPLVGKDNADDWDRVCGILQETLASVRGQSYARYEVLLCCQDLPQNWPDDPCYHFVQAPPHTAEANVSDQRVKVRLLAEYAARTYHEFTYVMHLDADDLLHPDLFAFVGRDNNGCGYLIDQGYMVDAMSGRMSPLGKAIGGTLPFWRQCGSCAFFAVDWNAQRFPVWFLRLIGKGHKAYAARSARLGYPLDLVPFPAALYVINHGDNMQNRKGNNKLRQLEANEVSDKDAVASIVKAFDIEMVGATNGDPEIDQANIATGFSRLSTMAFRRSAPKAPSITR